MTTQVLTQRLPSHHRMLTNTVQRLLFAFLLIIIPASTAFPCGGTQVPPCGRTVYLAKYSPGVIVVPSSGNVNIPIGVLPFAYWNTAGLPYNPICPQPTNAWIDFQLICPTGTFTLNNYPVTIGSPGPQPTPPAVIQVPVTSLGTLPQICTVVGTLYVQFDDMVTLSFTGDTEVCLVEPSPVDPTKPRLNLEYISYTGDDYKTCRRGDQTESYFLIENNDCEHSVTLDLESIGRQVAQLPDGFDAQNGYAGTVYSISAPIPDTDAFPAALTSNLMPGELLTEPDPMAPNLQMLTDVIMLAPCEAIVISITMKSYGMCANGSCNERLLVLEGTFSNNDPALACASTLLVVDDVPPKTALCEIRDSIKVQPFSEAAWSPAEYFQMGQAIPHSQTFYAGNFPPGSPHATVTQGDGLFGPFASTKVDYVRFDANPDEIRYQVQSTLNACDPAFPAINNVTILGIDTEDPVTTCFPAIWWVEPVPLDILFDLENNLISISFDGFPIAEGSLIGFLVDPPPNFCVDAESCRCFTRLCDEAKSIYVVPESESLLYELSPTEPGCDSLYVYDQNGTQVLWNASVTGAGIGFPSGSGTGLLEFCYEDLDQLPLVVETTVSWVEVQCPDALNNPVAVPVAIRITDFVNTEELAATVFSNISIAPNPFQHQASISFTLPKSMEVEIAIYAPDGRLINQLMLPSVLDAGTQKVFWNGQTNSSSKVASGLYFCRIRVGDQERLEPMVLLQ